MLSLVAHRGDAQYYPENTVLAFTEALKKGVHLIELDVQLTADHVPIILHDDTLTRTASCGNWPLPVMVMPWSQVKTASVGEPCRFGAQFAAVKIAALHDLTPLLKAYPQARVFVEIKAESVHYFSAETVVKAVLAALAPVLNQCIFIAFQAEVLTTIRQYAPCPIAIGWIIAHWSTVVQAQAAQLAPHYLFVDAEVVPEGVVLWPGPWQWVVYDITDPALIQPWQQRGAHYLESWDVGRLLPFLSCLPASPLA